MIWDEEFKELWKLNNKNKELINTKFKKFDEMLAKIKKSIERQEFIIKHFGE